MYYLYLIIHDKYFNVIVNYRKMQILYPLLGTLNF